MYSRKRERGRRERRRERRGGRERKKGKREEEGGRGEEEERPEGVIGLAAASMVSTTFLVDTWTQTSSPFLLIGLAAAIRPNSRLRQ